MAEGTIHVEIKGLAELKRAFKEYPRISEPILQRAIIATQAAFAKHTLKDNPVPWKTGYLLSSFRFSSGRLIGRWGPTAAYAAYVELGTKPHTIMPRNARVLAWQSGGSPGRYVTSGSGRRRYAAGSAGSASFARIVHHPGTKAQPYMGRIVRNAQGDINKIMKQGLDMVNRAIAASTRI